MKKTLNRFAALALVACLTAPAFANDEHPTPPPPVVTPAPAGCTDCWNGSDKKLHFAFSFAIGVATGNQWPNEPGKAVAVAMIPGVLKEVADAQKGGSGFSGKDLVFDFLGAAAGVYGTHWLLHRQNGATTVSYHTALNLF